MADDGRRRPRPVGIEGDERSDARERALLLLYESASKGVSPRETIDAQVQRPDLMTRELVIGVAEHQERLDAEIAAHAKGWTLKRMPLIDLTVMRIAGFELLGRPEVPVAVVLDEAVELAKRFSTDDSGRFVNGVLSALVPVLRPAGGPGPTVPAAQPDGRDHG
ncbi:MAG: transcription antitermination factor NusB [Actinobacteria bacterium]|nr:transcription antitermination factor NusB [Actinomycetota bacterium]